MSCLPDVSPAPVGQQGTSHARRCVDSWGSLRAAHGPLPLATGTAYVATGENLGDHRKFGEVSVATLTQALIS